MTWLFTSALLLAGSAQAQTLTATGSCPGVVNLEITGVTPGGSVAILTGDGAGSTPAPGGPCAGASTGLSTGLAFRTSVRDADGDGTIRLSPTVPAGACGLFASAMDLERCSVSRAVPLPDGGAVAPNPECSRYRMAEEPWRNAAETGAVYCDSSVLTLPSWYRFGGAAGTRMLDRPPGEYQCSTHAPGWMNGEHPRVVGATSNVEVCWQWSGSTCLWRNRINVTYCGGPEDFYVYELQPLPFACNGVYCAI